MSIQNWPGGIIRPVPVAPTGPLANGSAPGVWTLDQVAFWQRQGLWPIAGNFIFVEDVFSTFLYTGNGSTQTITNGIDLAGKGGLVWFKSRSAATDHILYDTARGVIPFIESNTADAQGSGAGLTSFASNGFTFATLPAINTNAATYASWTFREQPRFFDIVTWTGNGANRTIAHSLGSVPGCIMVKRLDATGGWQVYHRSLANTQYMVLNITSAVATGATRWNSTTPTSTVFSLGTDATVNANGGTYVAYLFAHDAGGFGATGADNVISCGSYTGNGNDGQFVDVGFEVQWLLVKRTDAVGDWFLVDVMRGALANGAFPCANLYPNLANAETLAGTFGPDPRGFRISASTSTNANGSPFIYIAIRRGPMRTPTSGTSVFAMDTYRATSPALQSGFVVDMFFNRTRSSISDWDQGARLIGDRYLRLNTTSAEATASDYRYDYQNGVRSSGGTAFPDFQGWMLRRAPGFFDVVCYTGTGAVRTVSHNLGVAPELMIFKNRVASTNWAVYSAAQGATRALYLNDSGTGLTSSAFFNDTAPTSSAFTVNFSGMTNDTAATYVAYLFASCPGVSKVGSYTGTGATQVINCGFSSGARFVLIKRTDSTGNWYVWDSARGIVAGNDPYLLLNSAAAEVTNTDWVDTAASGFELSNAAGNLVNTNGGSYIFLSIA